MHIKLDSYRVFCIVAEYKSFSAAAKKLYMTQPAISQIIMQLETQLDTRLFTRLSKGVVLTTEGQILYEYAQKAIHILETGEEKLRQSIDLLVGELKIGVNDTVSRYFLLPYLEYFHKAYPNIKLKVVNRTTSEQIELLKKGEIDLAICNLPIKDTGIEIKEHFFVHDIFVGGDNYKKLSKNPVSLEQLNELPLILLEKKSNSRQYVEKYIASKGVRINPEIELGSYSLLLEFAKINLGIACVVKEFSKEYLEQKGLYEIRLMQPIPRRKIGSCWLKSVSLSPAAHVFLEILDNEDVRKT